MSDAKTFYSRVAGLSFRVLDWDEIKQGMYVDWKLDPYGKNAGIPHPDPNAIALFTMEGTHMGYLPKDTAAELSEAWRNSDIYFIAIKVAELTGGTNLKPNRGINLSVEIVYNPKKMREYFPTLIE